MKISHLRWIILAAAFLVLTYGGLAGIHLGNFLPTFSCRYVDTRGGECFFWPLQHHFSGHGGPAYIIRPSKPTLLYFCLLIIVIGKAWCGWICPFGFIMDLLDLIRKKLHVGYITFPEKLRIRLAPAKWIFLFITLLVPLSTFPFFMRGGIARDFSQPFCQLCPVRYIMPLFIGNPNEIIVDFKSAATITMTVLGLIITVVTVIGSLTKRRFWCAYCPMGLVLGFFRKISFLKLKKNCQKCTRCEICYNVCPMEIKEVYQERKRENVTFGDCILCFQCIENCPEDGALQATFLGKTIYKSSQKKFFSRIFNSSQKRIKGKVSGKNKQIKQKELITEYAK